MIDYIRLGMNKGTMRFLDDYPELRDLILRAAELSDDCAQDMLKHLERELNRSKQFQKRYYP